MPGPWDGWGGSRAAARTRNEQLYSRSDTGVLVTCPFETPLMSVSDLHKHRASRDGRCLRREMKSSCNGRPTETIRGSELRTSRGAEGEATFRGRLPWWEGGFRPPNRLVNI